MDGTKTSVTEAGGNRGGRPRKDGLVPGSDAALAVDRKKDAEYQKQKRADKTAARVAALKPNPNVTEPALDIAPRPGEAPPVGLVPQPVVSTPDWLPSDLQPLAETGVPLLEEWRQSRRRKILAPLNLDAAATSKILSETRWPDFARNSLKQSAPETLASLANWCSLPKELKPHLVSIPALAFLIQHEMECDARLEKIVKEQLARQQAAIAEKKT